MRIQARSENVVGEKLGYFIISKPYLTIHLHKHPTKVKNKDRKRSTKFCFVLGKVKVEERANEWTFTGECTKMNERLISKTLHNDFYFKLTYLG